MSYLQTKLQFIPINRNETCIKLYNLYSDIIFNIILKVVSVNFVVPFDINTDIIIDNINLQIRELSPEEALKFKGFSDENINNLLGLDLDENTIFRLSENSGNVNIYTETFKDLCNDKK